MFNLCYLIVFCLFPIDLIDKKVILKIPIYKAINLFFQMSPFFRVDPGVWCGVVWSGVTWCGVIDGVATERKLYCRTLYVIS